MDEQVKVTVDMPKNLHFYLKVCVAQHHSTIRKVMLEAAENYINTMGVYMPVEDNAIDESDDLYIDNDLEINKPILKGSNETIN